jgi:hypothetical protein
MHREAWSSGRPPSFARIDYVVDFERLARECCRLLGGVYPAVLDLYYLQGRPWTAVARATGLVRGNVYHAAYRIEEAVGFLLYTLRPYPLYPVMCYLGGRAKPALPWKSWATGVWHVPHNE